MVDRIQSQRIPCTGGLNTSQNFLQLSQESPGSAINLINYETAISGGYRRISGYSKIDPVFYTVTSVGVPAEEAVLGIWGFKTIAGVFDIYAARKSVGSAVYRIYKFDAVLGWVAQVTGITHTSTGVTRVRAVNFSIQGVNYFAFVDGINELTVFNGTTWYECKSINAGGAGAPGGNQILDAPSKIAWFSNTLFVSGMSTFPSVVAYSAPEDPLTWTAPAGGGQQVTGFRVVQLGSFRDELFIFGETRISKSIADLASGFVLQTVTNNIGCVAPDSVVEVAGDLIYLSADGIRPISGTDKIGDVELSLLSQSIQNTINTVTSTYSMLELNAVTIRGKTQFRYFMADATTAVGSAYGIIGATRESANGRIWEFGELRGIRANCCWSGYNSSNIEKVYHGDYDGNVYIQESGVSFNGVAIESVYRTPFIDFGDIIMRKLMRKVDIFVLAEGAVDLGIGVAYDWSTQYTINPTDYNVSSTASGILWDGGHLWDDGSVWAGGAQPIFQVNIQGSGHSVQISIVNTSLTNAPFTIQGIVYEFSMKGRQ